jgi:hypothetical protein
MFAVVLYRCCFFHLIVCSESTVPLHTPARRRPLVKSFASRRTKIALVLRLKSRFIKKQYPLLSFCYWERCIVAPDAALPTLRLPSPTSLVVILPQDSVRPILLLRMTSFVKVKIQSTLPLRGRRFCIKELAVLCSYILKIE